MTGESVVLARGLTRAFGPTLAVDDVDLEIGRGEIFGLVGPNGAGKTTLMRMLATLLPPTRGDATVLGHDLRTGYLDIRREIGYLPDFFNLYRYLTLAECLRFFARAYRVPADTAGTRVRDALEATGLAGMGDRMVRHLSRGMVQRLGVATLLVRDAGLLILDEPASGLDPRARVGIRELLVDLRRRGMTILVSSHILSDLAEACTHIAIMDRGRIVLKGPVPEILGRGSSARSVSFHVLGDPARAVDFLRGAGFTIDTVDGDRFSAVVASGEDIAAINERLVREGIGVVGIENRGNNLEDLFLEITGKGGDNDASG